MKRAMLAGAIVFGSSGVLAADPPTMTGASGSMLSNTCAGCHGTDGASKGPATPSIAGLSHDYFVEVMNGFKSDEVPATIMGRIAKGYSEDEIELMAEFFSEKSFVPAAQKFDAANAEKGAKLHDKFCDKCHSEGGSEKGDDAGILAGQLTPYLHWNLQDFLAEHRKAPKKMAKQLSEMHGKYGDDGVSALLDYYASQQ